jgi:hypothetical protein
LLFVQQQQQQQSSSLYSSSFFLSPHPFSLITHTHTKVITIQFFRSDRHNFCWKKLPTKNPFSSRTNTHTHTHTQTHMRVSFSALLLYTAYFWDVHEGGWGAIQPRWSVGVPLNRRQNSRKNKNYPFFLPLLSLLGYRVAGL